jgi:hypothetical protein
MVSFGVLCLKAVVRFFIFLRHVVSLGLNLE